MTESRTAPTPGAPILSTARMLFALVGGPIAWALHFLG